MNAKDISGATPLHHWLTRYGNETTLVLGKIVLKNGVDPNVQNRFDCSPLFECCLNVENMQTIDAIKLFLKYGASPNIKEYEAGVTCYSMAKGSSQILQLFSAAGMKEAGKKRKIQKEVSGGSPRMCGGGCGKEGLKRCTGCYLVYYCGTNCQNTAWSSHSSQCEESRAQYKTVRLITQEDWVYHNHKSRNVSVGNIKKHKPLKNHSVVKVQVPLERKMNSKSNEVWLVYSDDSVQVPLNTKSNEGLFVYNEDRSICGYLCRGQEDTYNKLRHEIENSGFNGQKAFYYAIYKSSKIVGKTIVEGVEINVEVMLPVEKW